MSDLGIVSNCWRLQLEAGVPLDDLVAEAERRGYRHVELRQGCLGAYETEGAFPNANALESLPARFPRMRFNLALALPYLAGTVLPETPMFDAGLRAALAIGGTGGAHLRLVDTETTPEALSPNREAPIAEKMAALAEACLGRGASLSVENARQPWAALRRVVALARERLGSNAGALRLCYDPCNLLSAADRPDPEVETTRLRADEIALFHLKQSRSGIPLPRVEPGEIDWREQVAALRRIGYAGPRLFEIPADPDIWDRLEESRRYVDALRTSS